MKINILVLSVAIFLCGTNISNSQSIDAPYEVGTWQGFRSAAVSFTFDDGCANQFSVVMPMFNQYGFKMTFFTVINWGPNWATLQTAAENGHEVASHTMSHVSLNGLSSDSQTAEYKNSQDTINARISTQKCATIAYPNCVVGDKILCNQYYTAARGCSGAVEPSTPADMMNISSLVCGVLGSVKTSQDFINKANEAVSINGMVVFLMHAIDGEAGYSPIASSVLQGALDSLNSHKDKYWVTSFGNIALYITERNGVLVRAIASTDTSLTVRVKDWLDNTIFNCPLTIRRPLPENWDTVTVTQGANILNYKIVQVNSAKYVMFDVAPDNGDIIIKRIFETEVSHSSNIIPTHPDLCQNYPNPFNPSTIINYHLSVNSYVNVKVYDLLGREVAMLVNEEQKVGFYSVRFDISNLNPRNRQVQYALTSGVLFYRLQANNYVEAKKLLLLK